ncbi:hypothetical protein DL96DRAFT_129030 [Flagelloscypha sp. PMI_526]|nr:hypothetical protein DL96DRAFT_129030 [Flagelloscypha sp. PMI_526]
MLALSNHIPMSDSEEDSEPSDDEDEENPWGHETKESSLLEPEREPTPVVPAVEGEVLPVQNVFASAILSDSPASYLDQNPVVVDSTPPPPEPTVVAFIPAINTITATPTPVHTTPAHLLLSPSPPSSEPNSPPATSPPANPDPTTWSLPDVLAWLRSKHFSEDILKKFIEQDITGDVLLSLDV